MDTAKSKGVTIHLPVDFICGSKFADDADTCTANVEEGIPAGYLVCCCFCCKYSSASWMNICIGDLLR